VKKTKTNALYFAVHSSAQSVQEKNTREKEYKTKNKTKNKKQKQKTKHVAVKPLKRRDIKSRYRNK